MENRSRTRNHSLHAAITAAAAKGDKENSGITSITKNSKLTDSVGTKASHEHQETGIFSQRRNILSAKSSNGLRVNHRSKTDLGLGTKNNIVEESGSKTDKEDDTFDSGNANKARKIARPRSIIFGANLEDHSSSIHDTTTLLRSHTHSQGETLFPKHQSPSKNRLNSSLSFNLNRDKTLFPNGKLSGSKSIRKIKSQLTFGEDNDIAAFFKKSKVDEKKQLGLEEEKSESGSNEDDFPFDLRDDEVTFTDESHHISSMQKIALERDSPVYQRTHKVSMANLLSSSVDEEHENTFDFKLSEDMSDLETIMNRAHKTGTSKYQNENTDKYNDTNIEIEYKSQNSNGVYDDSIPDSVEGRYQSMSNDVLSTLWSNDPVSLDTSKFKDPLELNINWKNTDRLKIPQLDLANAKLIQIPEEELGLDLEFSDNEDEKAVEFDFDDKEDEEDFEKLLMSYKR